MVTASKSKQSDECEETVTLKRFLPDTVKIPHPTILLAGKRFAGKSTAAVALAKYYDCPRYAAWCGTKDTQDFWAERFGSNASVWGPDENGRQNLMRIIDFQERKIRQYKKILKQPFPHKYTICMIFDDVTANKKFSRGELLADLFSNGRHYKAVIIISCQYMKQLPPEVRGNTDYIVMLHNTKKNLEILHDEYVENPDDLSMFIHMLKAVINQKDRNNKKLFNALVYNNCTSADTLDGMFFVFRHEENFNSDKVDLGSEEWREAMKENHVDRELAKEEQEQRRKKRKHRLDAYIKRREQRKADEDGVRDVDYFSDSDNDSDEDASDTDYFQVQNRKGKGFKLALENPKEQRTKEKSRTPFENHIEDPYRPRRDEDPSARNTRASARFDGDWKDPKFDGDYYHYRTAPRTRNPSRCGQYAKCGRDYDYTRNPARGPEYGREPLARDSSRCRQGPDFKRDYGRYTRASIQDHDFDREYCRDASTRNSEETDWSKHRPHYPHLDIAHKPIMSWVEQKNFIRRACVE